LTTATEELAEVEDPQHTTGEVAMRAILSKIVGSIVMASCIISLETSEAIERPNPTPEEQYLLELINRDRANPEAAADRVGIDLNRGIVSNPISSSPKQPLAFNAELLRIARVHSEYMLSVDRTTHIDSDGRSGAQRMIEVAEYSEQFIVTGGENVSGGSNLDAIHDSLFRDSATPSAGHRQNMLMEGVREVGIGICGEVGSKVKVTEDFMQSWEKTGVSNIITGVVYADYDGNEFYSIGEGIAGATVIATDKATSQTYSTVTFGSGGYNLYVPYYEAEYSLVVVGPGINVSGDVHVPYLQNAKRDFTPEGPVGTRSSDPDLSVDIKVNGSDGPAVFQVGTQVLIQANLQGASTTGSAADWWVLAEIDGGLYCLDLNTMAWSQDYRVSRQANLAADYSEVLFVGDHLPKATYRVHFGVDLNPNGVLDFGTLTKDTVEFTID
jgi:hypothetical protein